MKKYLALLFAVFLFSCKPTQVIVKEKEYITKTDTLKTTRIEKVFEAVHDTTTIDNPCDSLGVLKSFQTKIKIPKGQINIRSDKGKIVATVNIDSIADVYENKYRSNLHTQAKIESKIVEKNIVPAWAIITIFLESIIILGYLYFRFIKPF